MNATVYELFQGAIVGNYYYYVLRKYYHGESAEYV
jgi:hypothetical protein